jgi:TIR domain/Domain of unknown function (DUF4062)
MARIYVSSTFEDLEPHRRKVSMTLHRLGHEDIAMDYYVAEDKRPLDRCLSDVASCDVYVGILAWHYGYVPRLNNPEERSITELEYRKAQANGIPCLIFLLSEEALWPRSKQDKGIAAERIEAFRQELLARHVISFFENPDDLARQVNEAVVNWEKESWRALQYHSCFISYSAIDQMFAERLHSDLQARGVQCWFAPHDLPIGAKTWDAIDEAIRVRDKLLLILSKASIDSEWVEDEANKAYAEERARKQVVLFPIRIDNTVMSTAEPWAAKLRNERNIGDFRQWRNPDSYQKGLERLLRDLKTSGTK